MNNDLRPINTIPNFKRFCMTIGELPTSYLETMTYYEMLVWFTEYMKNTIIPTINNNGLAVEELQDKYIELKSYVDNYFTNLDVQQEINNKLDEMAQSGELTNIFAIYLKSGYVSNYGGKDNTNITSIINEMINTYGITYILCDVNGIIDNITILQNQNIIINFMGKEIKFVDKYAEYNMFDNYGKLTLLNGTFNGNNNNSLTVLRGRNLSTNIIDNCNFINFNETDNNRQTHIIFVYSGSYSKITNCNFENIKQRSNGTTTDYGGAASCILSQYDNENPTYNETSCIINNCSFKNNWNTNEQDEIVIDDFDNIKIQNYNQQNNETLDKHMFIISNITSYNSGKRVIKAQTNNVTINNINCVCDEFPMLCIISLFYNNHNVNNVYGKLYRTSSGIECLSGNNININNINIINENEITESNFKCGIILTKCSNININNSNFKGFSNGISIWDITNSIKLTNCKFESLHRSIYIYTRTTEISNPNSGISIENVRFENCDFITDGETIQKLYDIESNNTTNYINNINFNNCYFKALKTNYKYGTMFVGCLNSKIVNCKFDINNTEDGIYVITSKYNLKLINCDVITTNNTPFIIPSEDSRMYIDKLNTNSKIRLVGTSKMIIQYSTYDELTGNTETNCHIDSFDMSPTI